MGRAMFNMARSFVLAIKELDILPGSQVFPRRGNSRGPFRACRYPNLYFLRGVGSDAKVAQSFIAENRSLLLAHPVVADVAILSAESAA
jgi:hypothetical protein